MNYTIRNLINKNKDENIAITSDDNDIIKYSDLKKLIFKTEILQLLLLSPTEEEKGYRMPKETKVHQAPMHMPSCTTC